jgi:hypothetical protein
MNLIELLNELAVLLTGYFLFLFTDLVPSINERYKLGELFMYLLLAILSLDVLLIFRLFVYFGYKRLNYYRLRKAKLLERNK